MSELSERFALVARFLEPRPEVLIRHGRINRRAMRREMITQKELEAKLREEGIDSTADVRTARLESDGKLSVQRRGPKALAQASEPPEDPGPPGR